MARKNDSLDFLYGDYAPYTMTVKLRGVMPFLFNQNDNYAEEDPGEQKRPRNAPVDYEEMVWRDEGGDLAVPIANVVASIAHAGRYFKSPIAVRGSAKTTLQEAMVPANELASFGVKEWDAVDFRIARYAGKSRAPKPTWRPRLEKGWQVEAAFSVITPELYSPSRLMEIVAHAGRVCGIGDGRKLGFGRFVTVGSDVTEGITW
jgi:hypothetical protein